VRSRRLPAGECGHTRIRRGFGATLGWRRASAVRGQLCDGRARQCARDVDHAANDHVANAHVGAYYRFLTELDTDHVVNDVHQATDPSLNSDDIEHLAAGHQRAQYFHVAAGHDDHRGSV
jgi:hypothetical protein